MNKYAPEILLGIVAMLYNVAVVASIVLGVIKLYEISGSWHSLWLLVLITALKKYSFVRD